MAMMISKGCQVQIQSVDESTAEMNGMRGVVVSNFVAESQSWSVRIDEDGRVVDYKQKDLVTLDFIENERAIDIDCYLLDLHRFEIVLSVNVSKLFRIINKSHRQCNYQMYDVLTFLKCLSKASVEVRFKIKDRRELLRLAVALIREDNSVSLHHRGPCGESLALIAWFEIWFNDQPSLMIDEHPEYNIFGAISDSISSNFRLPTSDYLIVVHRATSFVVFRFMIRLINSIGDMENNQTFHTACRKFFRSSAFSLFLYIGISMRDRVKQLKIHIHYDLIQDLSIFSFLAVRLSSLRYLPVILKEFSPKRRLRQEIDDLAETFLVEGAQHDCVLMFRRFLKQFDNFGVMHLCSYCGVPIAAKSCGRCRNAWYCSSACQRSDWAAHQQECRAALDSHSHELAFTKFVEPSKSKKRRLLKKQKSQSKLNGIEMQQSDTSSDPRGSYKIPIAEAKTYRHNSAGQSHVDDQVESLLSLPPSSDANPQGDDETNATSRASLRAVVYLEPNKFKHSAIMTATFFYRYLGVASGMKVLMRKRSNPDTAFVPRDFVVLLDLPTDAAVGCKGLGYKICARTELSAAWYRPSCSPDAASNLQRFADNISKTMLIHQALVLSHDMSYFIFPMYDYCTGKDWETGAFIKQPSIAVASDKEEAWSIILADRSQY